MEGELDDENNWASEHGSTAISTDRSSVIVASSRQSEWFVQHFQTNCMNCIIVLYAFSDDGSVASEKYKGTELRSATHELLFKSLSNAIPPLLHFNVVNESYW